MDKALKIPIICLVILVAAALSTYAIRPRPFAMPKQVDIEQMPKQIAGWRSTDEVPMSDDLHATLKSADGYERTYISGNGVTVRLLLLSAANYGDYHSPKACFPAQGWTIDLLPSTTIAGQPLDEMTAVRDQNTIDVVWWFMADKSAAKTKTWQEHMMGRVGERMMARPEGTSLLVRIIGSGDARDNTSVHQFTADVMPALRELVKHRINRSQASE